MSINLLLTESCVKVKDTHVTIKRRGDITRCIYMVDTIEDAIKIIVEKFKKETFLTIIVTIIGDDIHITCNDAYIRYARNANDNGYIINTNTNSMLF